MARGRHNRGASDAWPLHELTRLFKFNLKLNMIGLTKLEASSFKHRPGIIWSGRPGIALRLTGLGRLSLAKLNRLGIK